MSDVVTIALISALAGGIPATIAAWAGLRNGRKVDETNRKSDVIHELVNSRMTQVKADLVIAHEEIATLKELVAHLTEAQRP